MGGRISPTTRGRGFPRPAARPGRRGLRGLRRALRAVTLSAGVCTLLSLVACGGAATKTGAPGEGTTSTRFTTEARLLAPSTGHFSSCPDCHSFLDPPGADRPLLNEAFGHEVHLERGASCEDCHPTPVHAEEGTRRPGMAQCFECHGQDVGAEASGECDVCHPPDMPLEPGSHTDAFFEGGHAQTVAVQGTEECFVCHEGDEETFCTGCHGLEMPHPEGWVVNTTPDPGDHTDKAFEDARVCVRCHGNTDQPAPPGCYEGECHGGP